MRTRSSRRSRRSASAPSWRAAPPIRISTTRRSTAQITEQSWIKPRDADTDKQLAATSDFLDRHPPRGRGLIRGAVNVVGPAGFLGALLSRRGGAGAGARHDHAGPYRPRPRGGGILPVGLGHAGPSSGWPISASSTSISLRSTRCSPAKARSSCSRAARPA